MHENAQQCMSMHDNATHTAVHCTYREEMNLPPLSEFMKPVFDPAQVQLPSLQEVWKMANETFVATMQVGHPHIVTLLLCIAVHCSALWCIVALLMLQLCIAHVALQTARPSPW